MSSTPLESDGVPTSSTAIDRIALVLGLFAVTAAACFANADAATSESVTVESVESEGAEGTEATGAPEAQQLTELFSHALHVRAEWWTNADDNPEFAQDCRGCHVQGGDETASGGAGLEAGKLDHGNLDQGLCFSCHLTSVRRFEPGPGDVPSAAADPFPHGAHGRLSCRECHGPTPPGALRLADDAEVSAAVPLALPIPDGRNGAACEACHLADPSTTLRFELVLPAGATDAERHLELTGAELRERYIGQTGPTTFEAGTVARFDHADHVDVSDGSTCATCHTGFATSTETGSIEVDRPESCQRCHIGTRFDFEDVIEPSRTAATFLHDAHVGAAGLACTACHAYTPADPLAGEAAVGHFGLSARFGDGASGGGDSIYRACADCHDGVDRAPKMPTHHGGEAFAACGDCHAFTHPLPTPFETMRSARPEVEVERPGTGGYGFTDHAHGCAEFGTEPGDCSECHWAPREQRASNILGRPFDHRTHLAPDAPTGASCAECHTELPHLASPRNLTAGGNGLPANVSAVFDPTTCGDCHGQEASIALAEASRVARVEFDHAAHLARDGVTCLTCHESTSSADAPLTFAARATARDCTMCHGHVDLPDATGHGTRASNSDCDWSMGPDDVATCAVCHTTGIPLPLALRDGERQVEPVHHVRRRLTTMSGSFTHPEVDRTTNCADCHLQDERTADQLPAGGAPLAAGNAPRTIHRWTGSETRDVPRVVTNERGSSMAKVTSPHFAGSAEDGTGFYGLAAILGEHGNVSRDDVSLYFGNLFDRKAAPLADSDEVYGRHCLACHWSVTGRQSEKFRRFTLPRNFRESEGLGAASHWRAGLGLGTTSVRAAIDSYRRALDAAAGR